MITLYRIDVFDSSGDRVAVIDDFLSLVYIKRRNSAGECTFTLWHNHTKLEYLADDCIIQILRNQYSGWEIDFTGIYKAEEITVNDSGVFTAHCIGLLGMLNDRIVAYPPETVNRSVFDTKPAETVLHTLVKYNATSSGTTADGRIRLATITGLSVDTDSAGGPTIDYWECAEQNLLDAMSEICEKYKVAHTIVATSATAFEWQYVTNVLADDQIFSVERGNVESITYRRDRRNTKTVAIIGSTGEGTLKNYDIRTSSDYDVSTNNKEMYVNTNTDDLDEIYLEGDRELLQRRTKPEIVFSVRQTDSSRYKEDFDLNYTVIGRFNDTDYTLTVSEVSISVTNDGPEEIKAILEDV